ncbi:xylose repressor [Pullulanibacillus camelliae]|uniref:Xylose repressor n=1 Tax=Pullulanibacillus camelliae TaxID=1707096 RepID=A0A8J3DY26_9BACL|nr:ROK family transcriptional regulator [Pullulanibacillus camelliae]GGE49334.1 xylose repressor [Pullulanibacillus camelliae]
MKTGDLNLVKKINKSIVLTTIQKHAPISRAEISEQTGLNKATVSSLVAELIKDHLIGETGPGKSKGGRRPVILYFNQNAGYAIGIDLGVNYILAVLTDLNGHVVIEKQIELTTSEEKDVIQLLEELIADLKAQTPDSPYGIIGIGIGVPGITDNTESILYAPHLSWQHIDLKTELENSFQIPVTVNNEANAGAHGEKLYGAGKDIANLIYVSAGIGIGTGIVINDELFKGAFGSSGEMGHMTIDANGKLCRCGNCGCWELYASEKALLEEAATLPSLQSKTDIHLEDLIQQANEGNHEVCELFYKIGEYLGIGMVNIANTFNPNAIILGNRLSMLKNWVGAAIEQELEQRLFPFQNVTFKFSSLGVYSCALGSAAFAIDKFFAKNRVTVE